MARGVGKARCTLVSYIPENAYLIYGDAGAIAKMQTWAGTNQFVQWEGDYADDYKIDPDARLIDANGNPQTPLTDTFSIQMVDDAAANIATLTLIGQWQLAGAENEYTLLGHRNIIATNSVFTITSSASMSQRFYRISAAQ
jgi:hypothetical protein